MFFKTTKYDTNINGFFFYFMFLRLIGKMAADKAIFYFTIYFIQYFIPFFWAKFVIGTFAHIFTILNYFLYIYIYLF